MTAWDRGCRASPSPPTPRSTRCATTPTRPKRLLRTLRAETTAAIGEIRQLVYGMRPPALDELGLVPALRQQADQLRTPAGRPLLVTLRTDDLPALAAAVEVAAYRITVEALTNSARHSGSDTAVASIAVRDDALVIEVRDGGPAEWPLAPGGRAGLHA